MNIQQVMLLSCNSTYRLRYWNNTPVEYANARAIAGCNSTYRLRYWNVDSVIDTVTDAISLQQYLPFTVLKLSVLNTLTVCFVATVLTVYGIETQ